MHPSEIEDVVVVYQVVMLVCCLVWNLVSINAYATMDGHGQGALNVKIQFSDQTKSVNPFLNELFRSQRLYQTRPESRPAERQEKIGLDGRPEVSPALVPATARIDSRLNQKNCSGQLSDLNCYTKIIQNQAAQMNRKDEERAWRNLKSTEDTNRFAITSKGSN